MNDTIKNIINTAISDASLDSRIAEGIVDLKNHEHIKVLAEAMYDKLQDENIVNEFVETFMEEGKYPDRQAYNKEGWLVTFPSKEYRDAAIKKRTHFPSDPTHGKGGMNLYYKRKGKQKRQTQQDVSRVEPEKQVPSKPIQPKGTQAAVRGLTPQQREKMTPEELAAYNSAVGSKGDEKQKQADTAPSAPASKPEAPVSSKPTSTAPKPQEPTPASGEAPAVEVPVVTQPPEEYASVSKKFAKQKGWTPTEYGEYHDVQGNPVAVVGLSGEVVPIRSNDREEYKIFAEKNKP